MITQFFGSFLLNNKLVSNEQLKVALEANKDTRVKLGVLAINAGYMTAEQVEKVNEAQKIIDKRIGDLSIELGFLTEEQLNELLGSQKAGALTLGQALVDKGFMTNADFEKAINAYKKECKLQNLTNSENEEVEEDLLTKFLDFGDNEDSELYNEYISLLFRNMIRFIGDEFIPMGSYEIQNFDAEWLTLQKIKGHKGLVTAISCDEDTLINFASRFAKEEFSEVDEYVKDSIGEFINLHNGIFCVNLSEETGEELELEPQEIDFQKEINGLTHAYVIPIYTTFGNINFIIGVI